MARDPDVIQREIEQTRAELAETIDAITGRINPKRAATRGANAVKAQVSSARERVGERVSAPMSTPMATPMPAASGAVPGPILAAQPAPSSLDSGVSLAGGGRSLRTDRVLMVFGAVAALAAVVVLRRSR